MSVAWIYCCLDDDLYGNNPRRRAKANLPFFADSYKEARDLIYNRYHNFKYRNIVLKRYPSLDYLNRKNGYIMKWGTEEDRVALQKVGFTCVNYDHKKGLSDKCSSCTLLDKCYEYHVNKER